MMPLRFRVVFRRGGLLPLGGEDPYVQWWAARAAARHWWADWARGLAALYAVLAVYSALVGFTAGLGLCVLFVLWIALSLIRRFLNRPWGIAAFVRRFLVRGPRHSLLRAIEEDDSEEIAHWATLPLAPVAAAHAIAAEALSRPLPVMLARTAWPLLTYQWILWTVFSILTLSFSVRRSEALVAFPVLLVLFIACGAAQALPLYRVAALHCATDALARTTVALARTAGCPEPPTPSSSIGGMPIGCAGVLVVLMLPLNSWLFWLLAKAVMAGGGDPDLWLLTPSAMVAMMILTWWMSLPMEREYAETHSATVGVFAHHWQKHWQLRCRREAL